MNNIPNVKLGIIAVSRDCFPITLSASRRDAIAAAYGEELYNCPITVENEKDALKAVADVKAAGCNALVVFLGNFGPETPETLICQKFDGPTMYIAAAEGDGDLINGRGDAFCGMLNCSYNLGMRHLQAYIPEYPVGTASECADMIRDFLPIARAIIGVKALKVITFGPRPQDFFACNAPIKGLYELGIEVEENSELDLLVSYKEHENFLCICHHNITIFITVDCCRGNMEYFGKLFCGPTDFFSSMQPKVAGQKSGIFHGRNR